MFGKDEKDMKIETQKIYLNEESSGEDAATEVLEEVLDGDVYGWNAFFAWKDLEKIYASARK